MAFEDTSSLPPPSSDDDLEDAFAWMDELADISADLMQIGQSDNTAATGDGGDFMAEFDAISAQLDAAISDTGDATANVTTTGENDGDDEEMDFDQMMADLEVDLAGLDDLVIEEGGDTLETGVATESAARDIAAETIARVSAASEAVTSSVRETSEATAEMLEEASDAIAKKVSDAAEETVEAIERAIQETFHKDELELIDQLSVKTAQLGMLIDGAHKSVSAPNAAGLHGQGEAALVKLESATAIQSNFDAVRDKLLPALVSEYGALLEAHEAACLKDAQAQFDKLTERAEGCELEIADRYVYDFNAAKTHFSNALRRGETGAEICLDPPLFVIERLVDFAEGIALTQKTRLLLGDEVLELFAEACGGLEAARKVSRGLRPGIVENHGDGPLGFVSTGFKDSDYPTVEITGSDGAFQLKSVSISDNSTHSCTIVPIGEFQIGKVDSVFGDTVSVSPGGGGKNTNFRKMSPKESWVGLTMVRGMSKQAYREVEIRELEHLVDFKYVFKLGPETLAREINAITGRDFDSEDGPVRALVEALLAKGLQALIPKNPIDLPSWVTRMNVVLDELADGSLERDRQGTHTPAGNTGIVEGKKLIIAPVFKDASLSTEDIVHYGIVKSVYSGGAGDTPITADCAPKVGTTLPTLKKLIALSLFTAVFGEERDCDTYDAGLEVCIESEPDSSGSLWISFPAPGFNGSRDAKARAYAHVELDVLVP